MIRQGVFSAMTAYFEDVAVSSIKSITPYYGYLQYLNMACHATTFSLLQWSRQMYLTATVHDCTRRTPPMHVTAQMSLPRNCAPFSTTTSCNMPPHKLAHAVNQYARRAVLCMDLASQHNETRNAYGSDSTLFVLSE